jgi:predicted transport protein
MSAAMTKLTYVKPERMWLKNNPVFNERWVQDRIAEDPSILGLGDIILKDKERIQPRAGRLDLLFQDADLNRRFEVEVQLGKTDESHIIRTIEYWDIERKRYPQYDHCAVIVAEDITSRFLNVISLFNGSIPLVAIQMSAVKIGEHVSLMFTTVMDQLALGLVDEDEEVQEVTDRAYWEKRGTKETLGMADALLEIIKTFAPDVDLKYNKFYIGLAKDGHPSNFAIFRPQKSSLRLEPDLDKSEEIEEKLAEAGLDVMEYHSGRYRIQLAKGDVKKHSELLTDILKRAYEEFKG